MISFFFFFKQKTAYEMRISDWSSDVCSSDLREIGHGQDQRHIADARARHEAIEHEQADQQVEDAGGGVEPPEEGGEFGLAAAFLQHRRVLVLCEEIGRASCRERVCQYG